MRFILTWVDAQGPQRRELTAPVTVVLGRLPGVDVVLPDDRVSRRHCSIEVAKDETRVVDLGSANGTFVNGQKTARAVLADGDRLDVGRIALHVELSVDSTSVDPNAGTRGETTGTKSIRLADGDAVEVAGYRFGRCLGNGSFGAVFEAWSPAGEVVAMKVLRLRADLSDDDKKRFFREAQAASAVQHPNVVRVLDQGRAGPVYYIVMEFVPGETVRALIERTGPLPLKQALEITRSVAAALEAARKVDLVHRDVKPDNILLTTSGPVKLADFGMAKSVATAGRSGLTNAGDIVGTLAYMAPEQLGASIYADHRSDIYSLGATLFHMLTGRTLFKARAQLDVIQKILGEAPPKVSSLRADVPPMVEEIVARCTKKSAADRYKTAGEIVRVLDVLLAKASTKSTLTDD